MPDFIIIQDSQISSITKEGIHYIDDAGNAGFIDFHSCYLNYLHPRLTYEWYMRIKELNPSMNISLKSYIARFTLSKTIGSRNSWGYIGSYDSYKGTGKPYLTFYTEPVTMIEFDDKANFWNALATIGRRTWHIWDET